MFTDGQTCSALNLALNLQNWFKHSTTCVKWSWKYTLSGS